MVLTSILVYGSLTAIMFFSGKYAGERQDERNSLSINTTFFAPEIILSLLAFAFICGARWDVGVDHTIYLRDYQYLEDTGHFLSRDNYEIGFSLIAKFFALFHIHFFFYFAFLGFLQLFFVLYAFKDERYLYPYFAIIIVLGIFFLSWNNGIRQAIATCIFLYSYKFIRDRQFIKFLISILLATLIHKSALPFIIFYFILNRDLPYNRPTYIIILLISIYLGQNNFWIDKVHYVERLYDAIGYTDYSENFSVLIANSIKLSFGGRTSILLLLCLLNTYFFQEVYEFFNKRKSIKTYFILYFTGMVLFFMLFNAYSAFKRITLYFLIFEIPSLSYLFEYSKNKNKTLYYSLIGLFIIFALATFILESKGNADTSNYKFFWNYII